MINIAAFVDWIRQEVPEDEFFVPKDGRNPRRKKWKDARQARNQIRIVADWWSSRPPHPMIMGLSKNGIPYHENGWRHSQDGTWREGTTRSYLMAGWNRPRWARRERHRNGKKDWGSDRDAWAKAFVQDKSSRARMRAQQDWWNEVTEALANEGF